MPTSALPTFLLASPDPALRAVLEPLLLSAGARIEVALTAEAARQAMLADAQPALAVLDTRLPDIEMGQLLAAARAETSERRFPIVLITDTVTQEWMDRLAEGVIDDLLLQTGGSAYWQLRLDMVLRTHRAMQELDALREAAAQNAQLDRLTGVYNREAMLAMLFRETDRAQRMNSAISLVLFDIDDFGHWNSRLGVDACDEMLCQVVCRTQRLLRSYDLLGRPGMDTFLVALPGCSQVNAAMLAERLRLDVFAAPFRIGGDSIRLSACFGIASSRGRSPVVVLREAEKALEKAKLSGPESIESFDESVRPAPAPVVYVSPTSGDPLVVW